MTLNAATYETQKRLAAEAGLNMVGSFLLGATTTTTDDVVFYETDGKYYGWSGTLPKIIPAGSTPATSGGVGDLLWVDRTDLMLRSDINIVQKRFACVADMVADTTLTVGKIVETIGYQAQSSEGGAEYEIVESSSGVPDGGLNIALSNGLLARAIFNNAPVSISQFGAVGNGINDDTNAFVSFRNYAILSESAIVLNLTKYKTYMVSNPWWPTGIKRLTVNGNNSKIKNNAIVNKDKILLMPSYGVNKTSLNSSWTPVSRYLINTTQTGSQSVVCTVPSDAGNFSVGEMILIACHDQQLGGQPPSYKFFEYNEIAAVDVATGTISLKSKTKNKYIAEYPYMALANSDGRAHIEKIEEGGLFNIHHIYNDIEFVKNDISSSGATFIGEAVCCCGKYVEFNNCTAPAFVPSMAQDVILNNVTQTSAGEFDKLVKHVKVTNSDMYGKITSATAIDCVEFLNTRLHAGYSLCPKTLRFIDCYVTANSQTDCVIFSAYGTCERLDISGGNHQFYPNYSITTTQTRSITLDGIYAIWSGSNKSLTIDISVTANQKLAVKLYPGVLVHVTQSYLGSDRVTGNYGVVRSISGAVNSVVATIDFISPLSGTEQLTVFDEPIFVNINGKSNGIVHNTKKYELKNVLVTSSFSLANIPFIGRASRITVDVKRAYTGSTSGNVTMYLRNSYPNSATIAEYIDLKTAGIRDRTVFGSVGFSGVNGESVNTALLSGSYFSAFIGTLNISSSAMAYTSEQELPIVDITIEVNSPYFH